MTDKAKLIRAWALLPAKEEQRMRHLFLVPAPEPVEVPPPCHPWPKWSRALVILIVVAAAVWACGVLG